MRIMNTRPIAPNTTFGSHAATGMGSNCVRAILVSQIHAP